MPSGHLRVSRIEGGRLNGCVQQYLGVLDQIGIEWIISGYKDAQSWILRTSSPTELLPQRCSCAGPAGSDDRVHATDVYAKF